MAQREVTEARAVTEAPVAEPARRPRVRYRDPDPAEAAESDGTMRRQDAGLLRRLDAWLASLIVRVVARWYLRKPDVAELLSIKIRSLGAIRHAIGNELAFRNRRERSHRLTSVNVEITNSCNLSCTMCPVNTTMKRQKRMMPFETFRKILDDNPGLEFVLPFQWGEPMLHRDFYRMVAYARARGIRVMATSNGTLLETDADAERLARCGLDRITFSSDGIGETHTRIRGFDWDELRANVERFRRARDRTGSDTKIDISMVLMDSTREELDAHMAAWEGIADRVQVIPLLTGGERTTPCRELWRGSLVVLADGTITPCCVDSEGALALGNIADTSLDEVWNGTALRALRRAHRDGTYPAPCSTCDEYEHESVSKRFQ